MGPKTPGKPRMTARSDWPCGRASEAASFEPRLPRSGRVPVQPPGGTRAAIPPTKRPPPWLNPAEVLGLSLGV